MATQHGRHSGVAATLVVVVVGLGLLTGCGSDSGKPSAAAGKAPAVEKGAAAAAFARLDPGAFAERMNDDKAVLINVHVPYEGELDHTDAFIPYTQVVGDPRLPADKGREILLYCRSGRMSEMAGNALHAAGYTNLAHLEGGMRAWEAAGKPLLQNPAHATGGAAGHM